MTFEAVWVSGLLRKSANSAIASSRMKGRGAWLLMASDHLDGWATGIHRGEVSRPTEGISKTLGRGGEVRSIPGSWVREKGSPWRGSGTGGTENS
jgi:hypothetical protein